jgi:hypothetical protein
MRVVYIIRAKIAHAAQQGEQAIAAALTSLDFCQQVGPEYQGYLPDIFVDVGDYLDEYGERTRPRLIDGLYRFRSATSGR